MILPLRRRHGRMFMVLGALLPLLFAAGIAARRSVPYSGSLPARSSSQAATFQATAQEHDDLFDKSQIQLRLWREQGTERLAVDFYAAKEFLKPDLLAYWSAAHPTSNDTLPADARLLGAVGGGPLVLPTEASVSDGFLILFSLANQEIADVSKPTRWAEARK